MKAFGDKEKPFEGGGKDFYDLYGEEFDHDEMIGGQRGLFDILHKDFKRRND